MANADHSTGICLHALPAREDAVIKRVISFSASQGRNYTLAPLATADLLVVSDETEVDFAALNPAGCTIIRIADPGTAQAYDVLMQRPLLVTKVMRTLDEANAFLQKNQPAEEKTAAAVNVEEEKAATGAESTPVVPADPEPSIYDRVMGRTQAVSTPAPVVTPTPVAPVAEQVPAPIPTTPVTTEEDRPDDDTQHAGTSVQSIEALDAGSDEGEGAAPISMKIPGSDSGGSDIPAIPEADTDTFQHRALVVDDSAAIRKQLELELRAAGIAADFAESGEQAMEKVAAHKYSLIFLDIIMPGIDGYETCRQMRLRSEMKKTPIIMLSAKTSPLDEVQGVIAGASTYLTKPVKSEQLQKTLKRVSMWLDNFQVRT